MAIWVNACVIKTNIIRIGNCYRILGNQNHYFQITGYICFQASINTVMFRIFVVRLFSWSPKCFLVFLPNT